MQTHHCKFYTTVRPSVNRYSKLKFNQQHQNQRRIKSRIKQLVRNRILPKSIFLLNWLIYSSKLRLRKNVLEFSTTRNLFLLLRRLTLFLTMTITTMLMNSLHGSLMKCMNSYKNLASQVLSKNCSMANCNQRLPVFDVNHLANDQKSLRIFQLT